MSKSNFKPQPDLVVNSDGAVKNLWAYVLPSENGIWIHQDDGSELSIYSREHAKALRDWLSAVLDDQP